MVFSVCAHRMGGNLPPRSSVIHASPTVVHIPEHFYFHISHGDRYLGMVLRYDVCYDSGTCPHGYCNPQLKEEKTSEFSLIIVKPLPVKKIMSQPFFCPSPIPTRRASKSLVRFSENANENSLNIWRFQPIPYLYTKGNASFL